MMSPMQRLTVIALLGLLALSACAKTTTSTGTTPTPTPTPAATSPSPSASASTAASLVAVVTTGTVTVSGTSETVLTDAQGFTLYTHSTDTPTSVCSGACAAAWPPLLLPSGPRARASVPGVLASETNPNGMQITYNGHPLYRWKNDTSPGQATGEGINNFHVATP